MLSAKGDTHDVDRGLEAGADDYMVKPFRHQTELVARIRTRLRKTNTDISGLLKISDLSIDFNAHEVSRASKVIALTRLEFDLLVAWGSTRGTPMPCLWFLEFVERQVLRRYRTVVLG